MKVLLVHDWLTGMRGGERCLEVFAELFPDAPLATLIHERGSVSPVIENREIRTSSLQGISFLRQRYRHCLPLLPRLMRSIPTEGFDFVLSSSHCVAKLIRVPKDAKHWCYIYTPMRYVWDMYDHYFGPDRASWPVRFAASLVAPGLRRTDREGNQTVDRFVAISDYIAARVRNNYDREAAVIHPPVSIDRFQPASPEEVGNWDLVVSAFAPYKRVDLAIEAANQSGRQLKIIGSGQDGERLRQLAGPTVEFLGALDDDAVAHHMARCRSFVFPGEEDFGITPVEVQAAGRPVVFYGRGGALETVPGPGSHRPGGVPFLTQTVEALIKALDTCDAMTWTATELRANAEGFSRERFKETVRADLNDFCPRLFD